MTAKTLPTLLYSRPFPRISIFFAVMFLLTIAFGAVKSFRAQLWSLQADRRQILFDYDAALAFRETAVRLNPQDAQLQLSLAKDARGLWFFRDEAELQQTADAAFDRAAQLSPHWFLPHYEHARMYSFKGQPARALTLLEPALRLDPNNAGLWLEKGRLLEAVQQHKAALNAYARCWTLDTVPECDVALKRLSGAQ